MMQTCEIIPGPSANIEAGKEGSRLIMPKIHCEFSDVFTGVGCFEGTFKLKMKEGSHTSQALPRRVGICTTAVIQTGARQVAETADS